ncbi:MAG: hypothetical protein KTR19_02370 [Hyphomicrobiales bacterium]|nr:hypothetical protein [Hyphomicrobiales bacterium]
MMKNTNKTIRQSNRNQSKKSDLCILLNEIHPKIKDDYQENATKTDQLQYIESLLSSLIQMTRQSGETVLLHLLNKALLETRDRRRSLNNAAES